MPIVNDYIQSCKNINLPQELSKTTYNFITKHFPEIKLGLMMHQPKPDALSLVESNLPEGFDYWLELLTKVSNPISKIGPFDENGHIFCFSGKDFVHEPVCIFIFKKEINESVSNILNIWQSLYGILKETNLNTQRKAVNEYGNLISQLLHDVQSLMEVKADCHQNELLLNKLEYQKKLNKGLLFFIRDFDLFKSEIEIEQLIKDSLKMIKLNEKQFHINIQNPGLTVALDVELFAEAFNQIIQNAVEAVESNLSKLSLNVHTIKSNSPFLATNWIVFEVNDQGKGISDDFIPYVTKPFFTTQKYLDKCGFGLANTKKIIEGHNGFLEISSQNGTQVKIIIPQN
ncbi:MAG: sensor histidine kinase [Calditrichaeota bacterium]|nr:MAG: sensor histidine kinase [Calditrichota bacterium]MBL1205502.1 sensor histidine kinase [Calditrichota bacterium]NOG45330.1 HAMP domain-containing histidine kinase [Calditrichota bacterium]